jgi:hypothetical protein
MTLKGRRPSFALIQALELVAAGHSVLRSATDAGIHNGRVWTAMKLHGAGVDLVRDRAAVTLAHYQEVASLAVTAPQQIQD